eukprot:6382630-Amphidinium_carterae.1
MPRDARREGLNQNGCGNTSTNSDKQLLGWVRSPERLHNLSNGTEVQPPILIHIRLLEHLNDLSTYTLLP